MENHVVTCEGRVSRGMATPAGRAHSLEDGDARGRGLLRPHPGCSAGARPGLVKGVASALGSVGWKHLLGTVRSCLCVKTVPFRGAVLVRSHNSSFSIQSPLQNCKSSLSFWFTFSDPMNPFCDPKIMSWISDIIGHHSEGCVKLVQ